MPTSRSSGARWVTVWSPIRIAPASGSWMPAIRRNSTVLPQPDGPNTTTVSPCSTASEALLQHGLAAEPLGEGFEHQEAHRLSP